MVPGRSYSAQDRACAPQGLSVGVVLPGDWVEAGAVPQCRSDPACDPYMSDKHDEAVKPLEDVADALRDSQRALRSAQVTARGHCDERSGGCSRLHLCVHTR